MLRSREISCMEASWQQIAAVCAAVGPNQVDVMANPVLQRLKESGAVQEQTKERDERRRNSEDEQEQGGASQQVALPTPGGFIQGAPASSLELDPPLVRKAPGEGGSAGRSTSPQTMLTTNAAYSATSETCGQIRSWNA